MARLTRRNATAALAAAGAFAAIPGRASSSWTTGAVLHLLPTASPNALLLKASFAQAFGDDLSLVVDGKRFAGEPTDSVGHFWRFRADDLDPGRTYQLQLRRGRTALCDPWPLSTLPAPESEPARFRLLTFTCAGGLEGAKSINNIDAFRPLALRRRLLARALSFKPDAAVANGDHIYWDQRAWLEHPNPEIRRLTKEAYDRFGYFDRAGPIFGGANEGLIKRLAAPQISALYGVMMRSIPTYFVNDDHDYFENDDATPEFVTFPPDEFNIRAARAVQRLFYPEFLPDPTRPSFLPGSSACDNGEGVSEAFGTLRVGRLLETLIYDCGRFVSLKGPSGGLIPPEAEEWIIARTRAEETRQLLHIPSHPMGWSAGKWREWYPDVVAAAGGDKGDVIVSTHRDGAKGRLTTDRTKFMWQTGWFEQHQRLASALSAQKTRAGVSVSGDLHAIGAGKITHAGEFDFTDNPVHSILSGPIGTSGAGWPSFARGTTPEPSARIRLEQPAAPMEKNGFTLIDVEPEMLTVRQFAWREPQAESEIDALEPFSTFAIKRR